MQQALDAANLKIESQQTQIRDLTLKIASLKRAIPKEKVAGKVKSRAKPTGPPTLTRHQRKIESLGKKFGVMNELFVPPTAFLVAKPMFDPLDESRYTSPAGTLNGVVAELYDEIPVSLHNLMEEHSYFREMVRIMS